jgi:RNA polymerase sigma-70 factor (ECF subfamily)
MRTLVPDIAAPPAPVLSAPPGEENVQVVDFEAVYLRFQGPIIQFIYRRIGNREEAYDLAQDVFVKAYKALESGTVVPRWALSAWLYRIGANTTTDLLRRRRLITWLPLLPYGDDRGIGSTIGSLTGSSIPSDVPIGEGGDGDYGWSASARARRAQGEGSGGCFEDRVAARELIEQAFAQMSPKYAVCLWLFEHDGRSMQEIAEALLISVSAVKMRLIRAREQFVRLYWQKEAGAA